MAFIDINFRNARTFVFSRKAEKQAKKLGKRVMEPLQVLIEDLASSGPAPGFSWPNYGKLRGGGGVDRRHCHLLKGKPTYVCCWKVISKSEKKIEVYYVGTHEKAPY